MGWTNGYDPTIGKDIEEPELIRGVWEWYSREQVDKMTLCEQINLLGKIYERAGKLHKRPH